MGEAYRARDTRLGSDVAIKVLPKSFSADADRLQRFTQEARAAAALNHPNILSIFDIGEEQGAPYIVSDRIQPFRPCCYRRSLDRWPLFQSGPRTPQRPL